LLFCIQSVEKSCTCWAPIIVFHSSSVISHASFLLLLGSTIFFIIGGFFSFGGCTGLEDYAPTVYLVVLSWLGGFFCGGFFCGGFLQWFRGFF
jgi:hypothetical protein